MTIEKTIQGLRISIIHSGYLVSRLYVGYSKREALRLFKEELKRL